MNETKRRRSNSKINPKMLEKSIRESMKTLEEESALAGPPKYETWLVMSNILTFLEDNGYIDNIDALHNKLMIGLDLFANSKCPEMADECKSMCPYADSDDCMCELIEDSYRYMTAIESGKDSN